MQQLQLLGQQKGIRMSVALIYISRLAAREQCIGLLGALALPHAGRKNGRRMRARRQRRTKDGKRG